MSAAEARERSDVSWKAVALPSEHGGWSLTVEPAVLGLVVAWSWPGLALGLAALVAFIARTPLKVVLVDRWRHRHLGRTRLASRIAAAELAVGAALVVAAFTTGASRFWVPLVVAAPLIGLELWYDMRSRSRRFVPELAGTIGIGSVAAAVALAGGSSVGLAWGLWAVIAARSVAAIPYVRTQILRTRAKPSPRWRSDIAQIMALLTVGIAWALGLIPLAPVASIAVLAAFNIWAVRAAPRPAVVIGIQQMIFGIAVVATTAISVLAA